MKRRERTKDREAIRFVSGRRKCRWKDEASLLGLLHQAVTPIDLWEVNREPGKRSLFLITDLNYATAGAHLRFGSREESKE
jgi:hypothetical protein